MPKDIAGPVIVSNADLVANLDYGRLIETHLSLRALATMAIRQYEYPIPFGVVVARQGLIQRIEEKPVYRVMVNGGVYVLSSEAIAQVPSDTFFDMPQLFDELIGSGCTVGCHPIRGYWMDIGHRNEYELANAAFDALNQESTQ
jgi:NDP-sugar pyrophosphorylase family protein